MKNTIFISSILLHLEKYSHWIRVIFKFSLVQVLVQLMGAISGFLLIRALDKEEYAYYTISYAIHSAIVIMATNGLNVGMLSAGGKCWQDDYQLGRIFNAAIEIKNKIIKVLFIVLLPVLFWLLYNSGAPIYISIVVTLLIMIGANFDILTSIKSIVLQLHSKIKFIQKLDFYSSFAKSLLIGIGCVTFINGTVAIAITSSVIFIKQYFLNLSINKYVNRNATPKKEDLDSHIVIVKQLAPHSIFFSIQGQITIWLVGIFGSVQGVAEIGALGRIGVIYTIAGSILSNIIIPRIARSQNFIELKQQYIKVLSVYIIFNIILVAFSASFPEVLLWILGSKYSYLTKELILIVILSVCSNLIGTMWSINQSRAWISRSWLYIPSTIALQILLLFWLDLSRTEEVIAFSIFSQIPSLFINIFLSRQGFMNLKKNISLTPNEVV